ncbi:pseudaminic acid synthase [Desulfobotulus sp. H1]|uniref:Pseudaminic acid synthase n=1 Tax=Desulfobotulus pelophilus TaxID=2823377 RepID=A0ABT3N4L2_9BACT|nr:pseudaminic acid synthase [Desulfobotulus pelophilus]MCW7752392.1 pseudaminic acid synthase [Desulfobotulus pelophilus]
MTLPSISIQGRRIASNAPPYIVAELSANHNGSLKRAITILETAKKCGADAVKLQTYTPDTLTLNCNSEDFQIKGGLWDGKTLYELYQWAHMPWDWHTPLFDRAKELDITIFSTPFDRTAVDLLEDLNAPAYKIASFEAVDLALIRYAASTKKPLILSTGMADMEEIAEAVQAAEDAGCTELALLHCVSGYPAPPEDYNLKTIPDMMTRFGKVTGLSDHTLDNATAIASVALGAAIIEKHFTLDKKGGGPDDSFSLEPPQLEALCRDAKTVWQALGKVDYGRKSCERANVLFRRSLYYIKDMKAGKILDEESVRSIRPGYGLACKHLDTLLGKRLKKSVGRGTPAAWEDIDI